MSSGGMSDHLRRVLLNDEVCPSWYGSIVGSAREFIRVRTLGSALENPEQAALKLVEQYTRHLGGFRVWVWRGLAGQKTTVRVLRDTDGTLSACAFAEDQVEHA